MRKIFIFGALLLSGCQPQPTFQQQCFNMGFTPDTDEFRQCTLSLYQQNQANRAAFAAAYLSRPAPVQQQPYMMPVNNNTNYTTNCSALGNNFNCNTYGGR